MNMTLGVTRCSPRISPVLTSLGGVNDYSGNRVTSVRGLVPSALEFQMIVQMEAI